MKPNKITKKHVIERLYTICKDRKNFIFDNHLVKDVIKEIKPGTNAYDMTKVDTKDRLPEFLIAEDYAIVHIGKGQHQFIKGIDDIYHKFEEINKDEIINKEYIPSILNDFSSSESSVLSLCYNQRITHEFLYPTDLKANPNVYNSERKTKVSFNYKIAGKEFFFLNLQVEIDLTLENNRKVNVFEGKNTNDFSKINNFNVFQLYNPFRFYYNLKLENRLDIESIEACYMLRKKLPQGSIIRVYNYTFTDPLEIKSIKLLKKREYHLTKEKKYE